MNNNRFYILTVLILCAFQTVSFAQTPPNLGTAANFALFTVNGALTNTGATAITGDIGTQSGAVTGFSTATITGQTHVANMVSAQAATDVNAAFAAMTAIACVGTIDPAFGNGQTLTPNVYCQSSASTLTGDLILDGQGDANAIFIFKIGGALSTSTFSNIILKNSASLCNVYWQVNGAFTLGDNSIFRGTVIANGAINLLDGATLIGRGLTKVGLIGTHNNIVTVGLSPAPPTISASGVTAFCQGGNVVLTASASSSYLWSNGATTQSITVTTTGNYTVSIVSASGCTAISATTVVTVNPVPTATISAGGAITFCQGGSVVLTASSGSSYLWSNNATTQSITVATGGNYTVAVTNASSCTATSTATLITVNALPTATISAGGAVTFCQGGSVVLTASSGNSYLWSNNATTQSITVATGGNYTVAVTNASSCTATSAVTVVTVNAVPVPTISAGGAVTFCQGGSVVLTASSGNSYLWSNNATTQSITVATGGNYTVAVTNGTSCTATSAATVVTVTPIVTPVITVTGVLVPSGVLTLCRNDILKLTSSPGTSYAWSTGETTQTITVIGTASGNYTVATMNANGCVGPSAATVLSVVNCGCNCR